MQTVLQLETFLDFSSLFSFANNYATVHQWRNPPIVTPPLLCQVVQKHHVLKYTIFQHKPVRFHFYFALLYRAVTGHTVDHRFLKTLHSTLNLVVSMYYQDFQLYNIVYNH